MLQIHYSGQVITIFVTFSKKKIIICYVSDDIRKILEASDLIYYDFFVKKIITFYDTKLVNKLVTITATGPQKPLNYAGGMSITPVAIEDHIGRAQISEKKDNIGPAAAGQVYGQVMKSKVQLLKPKKI